MTSKAKAKELFKKYSKGKDEWGWALCEYDSCAKQCALIAVDEILELIRIDAFKGQNACKRKYWQEVKSEINIL